MRFHGETVTRAAFRTFCEWLFTERQVIVRSRGRITFVPLSRIIQAGLGCVLLAGGGWFVYSTVSYFDLRETVFTQETVIARSESAYRTLVEEMANSRERVASLVRIIGTNRREPIKIIDKNNALKSDLRKPAQIRSRRYYRGPRVKAATTGQIITAPKISATAPAVAASSVNLPGRTTHETAAPSAPATAKAGDVIPNSPGLKAPAIVAKDGSQPIKRRTRPKRNDKEAKDIKARQQTSSVDRLDVRVVRLAKRLAVVRRSQNKLLNQIAQSTQDNIERAEDVVKLTGLNVKTLLNRIGASNLGQGGPFIPLSPDDLRQESFKTGLESLNIRMERWQDLQKVLGQLPLGKPMSSFWVSGRFGRRRDPFNRRWANHRGLDVASSWHAEVFAVAPGTVRHAGRKGRFGRLVEIDHGMGIRTRYGHLHRVHVKRGERVEHKRKIGEQGSSGRSQSAHLHYEILVNGRQVNPINFLKAGEYVFKG